MHGICIVTSHGPYGWIIANALSDHFGSVDVVREQPEAMSTFLKRRARKLGWISVSGQFATMALGKFGKKAIAARINRIEQEEKLKVEPSEGQKIVDVASINSEAFIQAISELKPRVILLVGVRMMKPEFLSRLTCPVLNYHAGINPQYRGMNGGYWALARGDTKNFGTTIHLVDEGVDTGGILKIVRGVPAPDDNIMTYAHRLAAMSRGICIDAVKDALEGKLQPLPTAAPSQQWYHPPIWQYLWTGITRKVW